MIKIYTDGSARNNGQKNSEGGYGVAVFNEQNELIHIYSEQCIHITNNQAELKAILYALQLARTLYKDKICIIYSDSAYCVNICNNWIYTWAKNNWINSKKQQIENIHLIQSLYNYLTIDFFNCQVCKCRGHSNEIGNEIADALATNNRKKFKQLLQENNIKILSIENFKKI